jgi:catechol 2,3-dioxygenase-like lactoylglutathione lyase family enzyme
MEARMRLIVDVKVADLDRAVAFYTEILGLSCRTHEREWAGITVGDAELHLYPDGGVTGDIEFYVEDIDSEVARLRSKGVEFTSGQHKPNAISVDDAGITTFPWGRTAFFRDSEGNELAVVKDVE